MNSTNLKTNKAEEISHEKAQLLLALDVIALIGISKLTRQQTSLYDDADLMSLSPRQTSNIKLWYNFYKFKNK